MALQLLTLSTQELNNLMFEKEQQLYFLKQSQESITASVQIIVE